MKSGVSIEELNAAAVLLTGANVNQLVEVHITSGTVTVITFEDGELQVNRLPIVSPEVEQVEPQPEEEEEATESDEVDEGDET